MLLSLVKILHFLLHYLFHIVHLLKFILHFTFCNFIYYVNTLVIFSDKFIIITKNLRFSYSCRFNREFYAKFILYFIELFIVY